MAQGSGRAGPFQARRSRINDDLGGPVVIGYISLCRGADVLGTGVGENDLGPGDFCRIFGLDGDENVLILKPVFITFGFACRDARADRSAGNRANDGTDNRTAERGQHGTSCEEMSKKRNDKNAHARSPTQRAANGAADTCTSQGSCGCPSVLHLRKVAARAMIGKQRGNVVAYKTRGFEPINNLARLGA